MTGPRATIGLALGLLLAVAASGRAETTPAGATPVRVAYTAAFLPSVAESDARAAIKAWALALAKEIDVEAYAEIVPAATAEEIARVLEQDRADLGGMTTSEFFEVQHRVQLEPIFSIDLGTTPTEEYVILVPTGSPARSLADLRGVSLKVQDNPRCALAMPWLELSLAEIAAGTPDRFFGGIETSDKPTGVVLPVFFGQAGACLVTRRGFQTMGELNPQIAKELRVLAASPPVIPLVWFLRRSFAPPFRDQLIEAVVDLHLSPTGRQILNLIQGDRTGILAPPALAETRELLQRWRKATGRPAFIPVTNRPTGGLAEEGDKMRSRPRRFRRPNTPLRGVARSVAAWLCPAWFASIGWCLPRPAGATEHAFRVAFSPSFFGEAERSDASAAVLAWQQTILKPDGIPFNPDPLVCSEMSQLVEALRGGEVDAVALQFIEYASIPTDLLETDTIYINERSGGLYEQYVLLVSAESGVERIDQLRGKTVVLWEHQRSCLIPTWLERLLAERDLGPAASFFAGTTRETKPAKAVLPVFFGQADACLVTGSGFSDMCELNPQVGKTLRVLATSPEVIPSFLCFRRGYESRDRPAVERAIRSLHTTAAGRQVLTIFGCDQITPAPGTCLQSAQDLWARWSQRSPEGIAAGKAKPPAQVDGSEGP